jgi:Beta/Gamma crystallin
MIMSRATYCCSIVVGLALAGALDVATAQSASSNSKSGGAADQPHVTSVFAMLPAGQSEQDALKSGCWAKLYGSKNFAGDRFTLIGPVELPRMVGPFGLTWENKVKSLEAGPKANLTIFDNRNFRDRDKVIAAGTKVPDLSKKMGFFDDFRSLKLSCGQ